MLNRDAPENPDVGPNPFYPEQLRNKNVAEDERPVRRRIRSPHAIPHHEGFVLATRIEGEEYFRGISVRHDKRRPQHNLGHIVDVMISNQ